MAGDTRQEVSHGDGKSFAIFRYKPVSLYTSMCTLLKPSAVGILRVSGAYGIMQRPQGKWDVCSGVRPFSLASFVLFLLVH